MQTANRTSPKTSLIKKLFSKSKPLLLTLMAGISAAIIPIWQIYFVDTADVQIEISSIKRIKSDAYNMALDTDELQRLEPYIPEKLLYEYDEQGKQGDKIDYPRFSLHVLEKAYEKALQDLKNISVTKANLQKHVQVIDQLLDAKNSDHKLSEFRVGELKQWDLSNYIEDDEARYYEQQVLKITRNYSEMIFATSIAVELVGVAGDAEINIPALRYLLTDVKEDIEDVIASASVRLELLRDSMRSIESQLEKHREIQFKKYSRFSVELIASNIGRSATSLRPLALMRVQISDDNYVDIRLHMEDYRSQAELPASSTHIIRYNSSELRTFPNEDQSMINTFWGTTGRVRLYALDTKHNVFISNQIAFVGNLNQKVMLDSLKEVAQNN